MYRIKRQMWHKKGLIFPPPDNLDWMGTHAAVPFACRSNDCCYRIYFSGRNKLGQSQTGFFDIDIKIPFDTLYLSEKPVLTMGIPGMFDDAGAMGSWIVNYNGYIYLYYTGWNLAVNVPFRNSIGLAISSDGGKTFVKYSNGPILDRSSHDPCFTASSCVLLENNVWRMWYISCVTWELVNGEPKHYYHIKYAESADGIEWRRDGTVCIDFKADNEYAISRPCVLKDESGYKMWYSYRGEHYRIGYAESEDGIVWERKDEEVGIEVSETGWDSEMICYPHVFEHNGEKYMLYNGNGYGKSGIGLAVLSKEK